MTIYQMKFRNSLELSHALDNIGADRRSLPFFDNRKEVKVLYVPCVDIRAANIIKQEMLSRGGDAAVHAHAIDCKVSSTDVLLFGTKKQLLFLADKIESMTWWNLPVIAKDIRKALEGLSSRKKDAPLPSGSVLRFGARTLIMGIINLTDDSFYEKSRTCGDVLLTVEKAVKMAQDGADILDIGAESTRPGSSRVQEDEEIKRMAEAVSAIRKELPSIPLSIDTTRASVAKAALDMGADIINDVSGLTFEPEIAKAAADGGAMYVLMHMRGAPETMQSMCSYDNILKEICDFFENGINTAQSYGLDRSRLILDVGLGFAKNYSQNLFLLRNMNAFDTFGLPMLVGVSRKGFVGHATDSSSTFDRLEGTLAVTSLCAWNNTEIVRVHDVAENKKTVMMIDAIKEARDYRA